MAEADSIRRNRDLAARKFFNARRGSQAGKGVAQYIGSLPKASMFSKVGTWAEPPKTPSGSPCHDRPPSVPFIRYRVKPIHL